MAWRVEILRPVRQQINGLFSSGALPRAGWIAVYNALYIRLPQEARWRRVNRYPRDPDCFVFPARFYWRSGFHQFTFYIRDTLNPGLLTVQDMDHEARP